MVYFMLDFLSSLFYPSRSGHVVLVCIDLCFCFFSICKICFGIFYDLYVLVITCASPVFSLSYSKSKLRRLGYFCLDYELMKPLPRFCIHFIFLNLARLMGFLISSHYSGSTIFQQEIIEIGNVVRYFYFF